MNILGTSIDSIDIAEDRDLFRLMMEIVASHFVPCSTSFLAKTRKYIGYPIMMRQPRKQRVK